MSFFHSLVYALIVTILAEYAIYLVVIRKDPLNLFLYSCLINSFTNPLFNYIYNYEYHSVYVLESGVVLAEGILISFLLEKNYAKAFQLAFFANMASFLAGLLIFG